MFDIKTCPTCEEILPPSAAACPACSQPGPEEADPWSLGTPESVAAATGAPPPPAPGSQLAGPKAKAPSGGLSTGAKVAIGVLAAVVVLGLGAVALFVVGARWLADQGLEAVTEGLAEEFGEDALGEFGLVTSYTVDGLAVGDCFSLDEAGAVVATACSQPHEFEVYHRFPWTGGEAYPGPDDLFAADDTCFDAFEAYVGVDYWDSALFSDTVAPSESAWAGGDRTISCALHEPFTELTGTERGSGR